MSLNCPYGLSSQCHDTTRVTKHISLTTAKVMRRLKSGNFEVESLVQENAEEVRSLTQSIDESLREGRVSSVIEKFVEMKLYHQFFLTGRLAAPSSIGTCNDEEYLGATLGFSQELARYAVACAVENDMHSISICRQLLVQLNTKMLEFDFRNGQLRRKYDGLKYALKKLEDVSYELSLVAEPDGNPLKKMKLEAEDSLICDAEMEQIRERMEVYDKLREELIKASRDVQKLSKQAIFAVHRGNLKESKQKLEQSKAIAQSILERMKDSVSLRQGAVSNCIEEWAEGMLFLEWMTSRKLLTKAELGIVNDVEYIGGLSDFTGEIGRVAVAYATNRNIEGVKEVMQTDVIVLSALAELNVTGRYTKKVDAVAMNLRKVEDIVYELTLLGRGGRAHREGGDEMIEKDHKGEDENDF